MVIVASDIVFHRIQAEIDFVEGLLMRESQLTADSSRHIVYPSASNYEHVSVNDTASNRLR